VIGARGEWWTPEASGGCRVLELSGVMSKLSGRCQRQVVDAGG